MRETVCRVVFLALILCGTLTGSAVGQMPTASLSEAEAYQRTWADDTPRAWKEFIRNHPQGVFLREARDRLQFLAATGPGTVAAYEAFLTRHEKSPFAGEARKTLTFLRLRKRGVGVAITVKGLQSGELQPADVRKDIWEKVSTRLTGMGFKTALLDTAHGKTSPSLGGSLLIEYEETPGEEFFQGPMSPFGMAEPVGKGTHISSAVQLRTSEGDRLTWHEKITAATELIMSGDMRQNATAQFFKRLDQVLSVRFAFPAAEVLDQSVAIPGKAMATAAAGEILFVAAGPSGLVVLHTRDFPSLRMAGSLSLPDEALDVTVSGRLAYVACGWRGLQIVDVSTPAAPRLIGAAATSSKALTVAVRGDQAYVAVGNKGLDIVDVRNPEKPVRVATVDTPGWAFAAGAGEEGTAYVADRTGLRVIEASGRKIIGSVQAREWTESVTVSGGFLYTGSRDGGIQVITAADPRAPRIVGTFESPYLTTDEKKEEASSDVLIVADKALGLRLLNTGRGHVGQGLKLVAVKTGWHLTLSRHVAYLSRGKDGLAGILLSPHMVRVLLR